MKATNGKRKKSNKNLNSEYTSVYQRGHTLGLVSLKPSLPGNEVVSTLHKKAGSL